MRKSWLALAAVLTWTGCSKNPFRSAASCEEDAKATSAWLAHLVAEGDGSYYDRPEDLGAVATTAAPNWSERWPHVALSTTSGSVDGNPVWSPRADMKALAHAVIGKRDLFRKLSGGSSPVWVQLELDRRLPWSTVVSLVGELVQCDIAGAHLVFDAASALDAPLASDRSEELHRAHIVEHGILHSTLDPQSEGSIFRDCRATLPFDGRASARKNLEALAQALPACGCDVDGAEAREAFWLALRRDHGPPRSFVPVRLAARGRADAVSVELPGTVPWAEAVKKVTDAASGGKAISLATPELAQR